MTWKRKTQYGGTRSTFSSGVGMEEAEGASSVRVTVALATCLRIERFSVERFAGEIQVMEGVS